MDQEKAGSKKSADAVPASSPFDARALVARMVAAGEWPAPELLQQIIDTGQAAVERLLDLLRAMPREGPEFAALGVAIGLLSDLRSPEIVPELVKIVKSYQDENGEDAVSALMDFGPAGFEALLQLCSDPTISGYQQVFILDSAADAAGRDSARRSRVAKIVTPVLDQAIADARDELKLKGFLEKHPPKEDFEEEYDDSDQSDESYEGVATEIVDDLDDDIDVDSDEELLGRLAGSDGDEDDNVDDDDDVIEPFTAERVAILAGAMATIADPLARVKIVTAFEEGLVDESVISRAEFDELYEKAANPSEDEPDQPWLDFYREQYAELLESQKPKAPASTPRGRYRYEDRYNEGEPPDDILPTAPIRNAGARIGRNDPCWCGSGKKYKKCHLGTETTE